MITSGFRQLLALSLLPLASVALAQSFWVPAGTNVYDPQAETLTLPNVYVLPDTNQTSPQLLYNVNFKFQGNNTFELLSTAQIPPEQECTRAEVFNAIDQLRLDLSLAEANELLGCVGNISRGPADLDTGVLVNVSWSGVDGAPNSGSGSFYNPFAIVNSVFSSGSSFIPIRDGAGQYIAPSGQATFIPARAIGVGPAAPFVTFAFRENVVESYSYSLAGRTDGMPKLSCSGDLLEKLSQLTVGASFADVTAALGCEGDLNLVTVSAEGERREISWSLNHGEQMAAIGGGFMRFRSQNVSASFFNNTAQRLNVSSSLRDSFNQACTIEQIVTASQTIQPGQVVGDLSALLECGTRTQTITKRDSLSSTNLIWSTQIQNSSLFTSENRSLTVLIIDDQIVRVNLGRF